MAKNNGVAVGIDLGTKYSCVAVWRHGRVEIIGDGCGETTIPSCVSFTDMERLICLDATRVNTIFDFKRLIGRRVTDSTVKSDMKLWPFKVIGDHAEKPKVVVNYKGAEKQFTPEELSSMVLCELKEIAEDYLGTKIKNVVVTVPAHFNDSQCQATKDAATIAGLNVLRLLVEPTAAAIAYGLDKKLTSSFAGEKIVLIFDLGAGTFDVSLLKVKNNNFEVLATAGDSLGGEDFDNRLLKYLIEDFKSKHGRDISQDAKSLRRLRNAWEMAKRHLCGYDTTIIDVDFLFEGIDYYKIINRSTFETLNMDLFRRCVEMVKKCLEDAKMDKSAVHDVVVVGGSSKIPKVQELLQQFFDGKKLICTHIGKETVAYGAAVQAAILSGEGNDEIKNLVPIDITPLSLGIEVDNELMDVIIPRNTTIPCSMQKEFILGRDDQTSIQIRVFEGERARTEDNNLLGELTITSMPPGPRGKKKYRLTFKIDANGILNVSAEDNTTGIKNSTKIIKRGMITVEEIERMVRDAERLKAEDGEFRRKMKARNAFQDYVYNRERWTKNNKNLKASVKKMIKYHCQEAIDWLDANDNAETYEYDYKQQQFEAIYNQLIPGADINTKFDNLHV